MTSIITNNYTYTAIIFMTMRCFLFVYSVPFAKFLEGIEKVDTYEYASFKDWLESNIVGRFTEEIETKIWDLYSEGKTTELYNELTKLGFQVAE